MLARLLELPEKGPWLKLPTGVSCICSVVGKMIILAGSSVGRKMSEVVKR